MLQNAQATHLALKLRKGGKSDVLPQSESEETAVNIDTTEVPLKKERHLPGGV